MEKILYENSTTEASPNAPTTIAPGTGQTDIAQQAPKINLARNIIGYSLPALLSYVQPLNSPSGFIFGIKHRDQTSIVDTAGDTADDALIIRKYVETDVREVVIDMTNEVIQDIESLFSGNFNDTLEQFLLNGGEFYKTNDNAGDGTSNITKINNFFLTIARNRILKKINSDFTTWLDLEATVKGTVTIPTYDDVSRIFGAIGELREALYKQTHKAGKPFLLVTPRIAGFLASTVGSTMNNGGLAYNIGQQDPSNKWNPFVLTMGDIKVYQFDYDGTVTGGSSNTTEATGTMIMGIDGSAGPDSASLYYNPYKEYIIQGGSDYNSGQSSVFFRVRDAFSTNPLDSYDQSIDDVVVEQSTVNPIGTNSSQFVVKADVIFGENLIT